MLSAHMYSCRKSGHVIPVWIHLKDTGEINMVHIDCKSDMKHEITMFYELRNHGPHHYVRSSPLSLVII